MDGESKFCIWSILAIIFTFIIPILGLVFGIIALVQIKKDPTLRGRGLAIASIVISILIPLIILSLVFISLFLITTSSSIPETLTVEDLPSEMPIFNFWEQSSIQENFEDYEYILYYYLDDSKEDAQEKIETQLLDDGWDIVVSGESYTKEINGVGYNFTYDYKRTIQVSQGMYIMKTTFTKS